MLGDAGLLFNPADADGIAQLLIELYSSTDRYLQVRDLCHSRRAYFDFDWPGEWERVMNDFHHTRISGMNRIKYDTSH